MGLAALAAKLVALLQALAGMMFAVGALCAIYMPMAPLVYWVSALVPSLFNLVFELFNDVIGWVGGVGRSTIGLATGLRVRWSRTPAAVKIIECSALIDFSFASSLLKSGL